MSNFLDIDYTGPDPSNDNNISGNAIMMARATLEEAADLPPMTAIKFLEIMARECAILAKRIAISAKEKHDSENNNL